MHLQFLAVALFAAMGIGAIPTDADHRANLARSTTAPLFHGLTHTEAASKLGGNYDLNYCIEKSQVVCQVCTIVVVAAVVKEVINCCC